jgi:tryptophan synthase alpha chain
VNGTERIAAAFRTAAAEERAALTIFLAAGDPDYGTTVALARAAVSAGADILELGCPFSDPLADGPIIQAAYTRALAGGATTAGTLSCAAGVAAATGVPIVLMVAVNCVLARGVEHFCREAAAAGVSGLLVPDLPVEDSHELRDAADRAGLAMVFLVGPDSGEDRTAAATAASTGFVYVVRRRGVTGAGPGSGDLAGRLERTRAAGSTPVVVGFGVATPADVAELAGLADGIVVGSALVRAAFEAGSAGPATVAGSVRLMRRAASTPGSQRATMSVPETRAGAGA